MAPKSYTNMTNVIATMERRQRLIEMRECLRQVQQILPKRSDDFFATQFICNVINHGDVTCSEAAKEDAKKYVQRAIGDSFTFNDCLQRLNPGRVFGPVEIMTLRQKFIDSLCHRINIEIEKTT